MFDESRRDTVTTLSDEMMKEEIKPEDNDNTERTTLHGGPTVKRVSNVVPPIKLPKRKSGQAREPLVLLQSPSVTSNSSGTSPSELCTEEMVDHLVQTLGLIGVSPSFPRRPTRPSRISLQHTTGFKVDHHPVK